MSEKQKQAFEKFLKDLSGDHPAVMPTSIEYLAWETWKGAIASVIVSIPEPELNGMLHPSDVKAAIERAGVGYK